MSVRNSVSIDEYLHTNFSGLDREYRDGEIIERSLPDYTHGKTQGALYMFFALLKRSHSVYPCTETRVRLNAHRVLIPDVAVFHPDEPSIAVPATPPLIAIEILSPDDRMSEVREKLEEYRIWGVPHVWLLNPRSRKLFTWHGRLNEVDSLTIPELGIELGTREAFE